MKPNNQTLDRISQLKNQLFGISIISVLILTLTFILMVVFNNQNDAYNFIYIIVGSIVLFVFFMYALKKMQKIYYLAIDTLEQQHQDITISKLCEKECETQYMDLFNNMLDAFAIHELILDTNNKPKDYRFLLINPAFERMTGLKRDELIGRTVRDVLPETEQYWIDTYSQVALTGEPIRFEHYTKELDSYFEVCAYRLKPGQFACIFQNITRRKKAESEQQYLEKQLRQSHKMEALGTLAGGVAHDFNNLLMPIMGYTEMMLDDFSDNSEALFSLNEILNAASRAKKLAEQILTFSRRSKMKSEPVDLELVIAETIPLLRSIIPKSIEIKQHVIKKGHKVLVDPSQFQQIIMNLCTNAYHAIEKDDGVISISLNEQYLDEFLQWNGELLPSGQYLDLSIEDNGQGIDLETQERIFDPYFTTKEKGKGIGLGLSMVLGIVNRFNGGIYLKSTTGKGSCFHIYLPVIEADSDSKENVNNAHC
jgi:PAS domain S-box-containing protein